jgi:hypothetical protein
VAESGYPMGQKDGGKREKEMKTNFADIEFSTSLKAEDVSDALIAYCDGDPNAVDFIANIIDESFTGQQLVDLALKIKKMDEDKCLVIFEKKK